MMVMLLAILCLLFSCATSRGVTLHASDDGTQVMLRRGQDLVISLAGNPTTGYTWEAVAYDERILRQVGEPTFTPESNAAGAPGRQVLRFEALGEGQTTLQLIYHRPWEDAEPEKAFSVDVVVR
jgi:inhibitor of cysteine peptidase